MCKTDLIPILTYKTTSEHTLLIFLNHTRFDDTLLSAPLTVKVYVRVCFSFCLVTSKYFSGTE